MQKSSLASSSRWLEILATNSDDLALGLEASSDHVLDVVPHAPERGEDVAVHREPVAGGQVVEREM